MTESIMPGFFIHSVSLTPATGTNPRTASVLTGEACLLCTWDELRDVRTDIGETRILVKRNANRPRERSDCSSTKPSTVILRNALTTHGKQAKLCFGNACTGD